VNTPHPNPLAVAVLDAAIVLAAEIRSTAREEWSAEERRLVEADDALTAARHTLRDQPSGEWRVAFTMRSGPKVRRFTLEIPAVDEGFAVRAAYDLAWAVRQASGGVWEILDGWSAAPVGEGS
jgi:hypothetical protein